MQFGTANYEDFYLLSTVVLDGDQFVKDVFNPVRIYKYDKSADSLTLVLDEDDGQPQLAHPYQLGDELVSLADNRKNFQVIRRSSKTLIFYRRVESSQSSIAYYNETDDDLTNIYTLAHSTGDGVPYSMDFLV